MQEINIPAKWMTFWTQFGHRIRCNWSQSLVSWRVTSLGVFVCCFFAYPQNMIVNDRVKSEGR